MARGAGEPGVRLPRRVADLLGGRRTAGEERREGGGERERPDQQAVAHSIIPMSTIPMPTERKPSMAATIEARRPDLPILYTSGYSNGAVHKDFVLDDGLALLQKPYAPEVLLKAVRDRLDTGR